MKKKTLEEKWAELASQALEDYPDVFDLDYPGPACEDDPVGPEGFICTREDGHLGDHVAVGLDLVYERWPR